LLDHATERIFVPWVGRRCIFVHRLPREYFAERLAAD
jgi:hypothetical protein